MLALLPPMLPYRPFTGSPALGRGCRKPPRRRGFGNPGKRAMLQAIHDNLKGVFAIVIIGVIGVVFVFWGVEFVSVGGLTAAQGIEVNGAEMDASEVRRTYQEQLTRYQAALGDADLPEDVRERLKQDVLEAAIRTELIRQRTDALRFRATDQEVLDSLQEIPAFQVDGRFSRDAYHAALRSANLEPAWFEAQQRQSVAAQQLDRGIFASAFVLPGELARRHALLDEVREVAWVVLPAGQFLAGVQVDDAALAGFYERHKQDYRTEERVNLRYIELDLAGLLADVTVTDDALRAYYEDNIARHATSERRRARHILVTDGEDAEARARAAYDRAVAGEDFARLAGELSQDPGSSASGGDLGWAEKSFFVGPFADAVWSMQPGEIKGPVRSEFGWHVIKLEQIEASQQQSFDEVRAELESEYRRAKAEEQFGDLQEQLDTVAFEASGDLDRVANELALPVKALDDFTRAGGGALGASPGLIKAVFEPNVLSGEQLATLQLAPGLVVAVKVVAHAPPRERPLEDVRAQVTEALRTELARELAAARAATLADELRAGADWATVARSWAAADGGATPRFVGREDAAVPPAVSAAAFKAGSTSGGPRYGSAALAAGDTALWAVRAVMPGTLASLSPQARAEVVQNARMMAAYQDASTYVDHVRAQADVRINPRLFE